MLALPVQGCSIAINELLRSGKILLHRNSVIAIKNPADQVSILPDIFYGFNKISIKYQRISCGNKTGIFKFLGNQD